MHQLILTDPDARSFELQNGGLEEAFLALTANYRGRYRRGSCRKGRCALGDALVSINGMPTSRKTEAELESLFSAREPTAREPTMMHLQIDRVGSLKNINFRLEKAEDIARENGKRFVNGEIVPLWANDKDLHCF